MGILRSRRITVAAGDRRLVLLVSAAAVITACVQVNPGASGSVLRSREPVPVTERQPPPDQSTPLVATIVKPPQPVRGSDGKVHLAYELLLLNTTAAPVVVRRIDTFDAAHRSSTLSSLSGGRLRAVMGSITGAPGVRVGPAATSFVVMDLRLDPSRVPTQLGQRLTVRATADPGTTTAYVSGRSGVIRRPPAHVRPPLHGARWVDLNGCCADASAHRTALLAVNGGLHLAQRFAIDFVQLQPDGRLVTGPLHRLSSFPYYSTPVRSATDGVVVQVRDGLPNQVPFQPPTGVTVATAAGNHVIIKFGHRRYAMYAHLKPGSTRVTVGDHVEAGQIVGRVGNTGNSDLPHLHFQIMDAPSPLGSEGLPFVFPAFTSPGSVPPIDQIDPTQPIPVSPQLRGNFHRVMPLNRQVVTFLE